MGESASEAGCGRGWRGRARASFCREQCLSSGCCAAHWATVKFGGKRQLAFSTTVFSLIAYPFHSPPCLQGDCLMIGRTLASSRPSPTQGTPPSSVQWVFGEVPGALQCSLLCLTFTSHSWLHTELQIKVRTERLRFKGAEVHWCNVWDVIRQSAAFPLPCGSWAHREGMDTHPTVSLMVSTSTKGGRANMRSLSLEVLNKCREKED